MVHGIISPFLGISSRHGVLSAMGCVDTDLPGTCEASCVLTSLVRHEYVLFLCPRAPRCIQQCPLRCMHLDDWLAAVFWRLLRIAMLSVLHACVVVNSTFHFLIRLPENDPVVSSQPFCTGPWLCLTMVSNDKAGLSVIVRQVQEVALKQLDTMVTVTPPTNEEQRRYVGDLESSIKSGPAVEVPNGNQEGLQVRVWNEQQGTYSHIGMAQPRDGRGVCY